jgi:phage tail P2-like protein
MPDLPTLLPPGTTPMVRAAEQAMARIGDIGLPLEDLWNPATCPLAFLPWLAWGLSIDFWDADWTEAEKRAAIAGTIEAQRCKGTRASLRAVLDRFDPLIGLVEWFEAAEPMDPGTIRLDLPLPGDTAVDWNNDLVAALLRDIAQVKPLSVHMDAVYLVRAQTSAWLDGAAWGVAMVRFDTVADEVIEGFWADYLQTEIGEPIAGAEPAFLETA